MSVESCPSSMAGDMEEVCSESPRNMKDMEETTSEASWTRCGGWNRRVKRTEKPDVGFWSEVKGVSVNPAGDSRHRHVLAKMARKEKENQTRMERRLMGRHLGTTVTLKRPRIM